MVEFRFLAALTGILTSGVAIRTQVGAAGLFPLVALALVELPLVRPLAAPAQTDRVMCAANQSSKARRHRVFALVLGVLGGFLVSRGMGHV